GSSGVWWAVNCMPHLLHIAGTGRDYVYIVRFASSVFPSRFSVQVYIIRFQVCSKNEKNPEWMMVSLEKRFKDYRTKAPLSEPEVSGAVGVASLTLPARMGVIR